ncbi:hypothetical protein D3C77_529010 [compost metagenome]
MLAINQAESFSSDLSITSKVTSVRLRLRSELAVLRSFYKSEHKIILLVGTNLEGLTQAEVSHLLPVRYSVLLGFLASSGWTLFFQRL